MEIPHFLTMDEYHLSRKKAEELVTDALKQLHFHKPPNKNWSDIDITISNNGSSSKFKFHQLVKQARLTGIAIESLQKDKDLRDETFGRYFSLATPNHQLSINTLYAGYSKEFRGPCRVAPCEDELTEDIIFYRQQVCANSNSNDFSLTCRYYRAYVLACISLVDAFINRHILLLRHQGCSSPEFQDLEREFKIENKIDLWLKTYTSSRKNISAINRTKEWNHFVLLKEERNMLTHAVEPYYGHQIYEIANSLNYVRTGIGGLLFLLRRERALDTLGFIQKLMTSPQVRCHEITLKADGEHIIKMKK
ncbi:hypothetical protein [Trichormus variabilis]|uniref:Uncharacterized protein n=1 Tax=Trichormus variabilis SAG 1403-4b TaxID=447716 RepID=A0A433UWN8_ANAVA|nr:hypothetical protein [Trichormus variabilis]MBD2626145.1 hypothetical protein [Trichormus variabilis FACHB-164]RUS98238.1 hypothetical protein DSM107003_13260 [Trichormus variabilis SAG 1403-4b]